ncbi:MAG: diadenylate cyclase [Planctomycetota bacterium]
MNQLSGISDLIDRLGTYPWWEVLAELVVLWLVVFLVFRFVQGTRAAGALKGILVVFLLFALVARLVSGESFARLALLYDKFLGVAAIALIVIFQPELRRAVIRLGETPFFRQTPKDIEYVVDQIADACTYLAKAKFGAIIVIERQVGLQGLTEGGTPLRAELTTALLQTLFYPGTALHDLAVIVRGRVVHAAGVQLPLAEPQEMPDPTLGSRHRAAVGITKECDALVVIVSEETGLLRLAERGRLTAGFTPGVFRAQLRSRLDRNPDLAEDASAGAEAEDQVTLEGTIGDPAAADDPQGAAADDHAGEVRP